jgi:hypothetical protein
MGAAGPAGTFAATGLASDEIGEELDAAPAVAKIAVNTRNKNKIKVRMGHLAIMKMNFNFKGSAARCGAM